MKWYERHPSDYKDDTWHLTLAEHGAYTLLLDHYYSSEAPLPEADRALSSICACGIDEWLAVKDNVLSFFDLKRGRYFSKKCESILNKAANKNAASAKRVSKYRKTKKNVTHITSVSNAPTLHNITLHKKESKKGSRISEDWKPSEANKEYAISKGFHNGQIQTLADKFLNYWLGATGKNAIKLDWDATWRNKVINEAERLAPKQDEIGDRIR